MATSQSKNEMLVMVLTDLVTICDKLIDSPAVPEELRWRASEFVSEFNRLLPDKGHGTANEHFKGEALLSRMARFLPRLLEVQAAQPSQRTDLDSLRLSVSTDNQHCALTNYAQNNPTL